MQDALKSALADFYKDYVRKGHPSSIAVQGIRQVIEANPAARDEAMQRMVELSKLDNACGGKLAQRCFISHVEHLALQEALT